MKGGLPAFVLLSSDRGPWDPPTHSGAVFTSLGSKMVEGATIPLILAALWMIASASSNRP